MRIDRARVTSSIPRLSDEPVAEVHRSGPISDAAFPRFMAEAPMALTAKAKLTVLGRATGSPLSLAAADEPVERRRRPTGEQQVGPFRDQRSGCVTLPTTMTHDQAQSGFRLLPPGIEADHFKAVPGGWLVAVEAAVGSDWNHPRATRKRRRSPGASALPPGSGSPC